MSVPARARPAGSRGAAARGDPVFRFPFHRLLLLSPIAALIAQLVLTAAAAAVTGGGDFPIRR